MRRALLAGMVVLMALPACEDEPVGPNDVSPPGRVTDLSVSESSTNRLILEWTAPGDDGHYGRAARYEIRRAGATITEATFEYATVIATLVPDSAGTAQQFVVNDVDPASELHFALRAVDEAGNVSKVSADAGWMVRFRKDIAAIRDNTMYEESPDSSNGRGTYVFCGRAGGASPPARRGLIAFSIHENIPAAAIIDSAEVRLHLSPLPGETGTRVVALHRAGANWGEGSSNAADKETTGAPAKPNDATWTYRLYNTALWTSPGGDYDAAASAQASVASTGFYTWKSAQLAEDVRGWFATPSGNFGWALIGDETAGNTVRRFDSREHPTAGNGPRLSVFYTIQSLTTVKVVSR